MRKWVISGLTLTILSGYACHASAQSEAAPSAISPTAQVEDLTVVGKPIPRQAEEFVETIGAPPPGRKLATWTGKLCIGAMGMDREPATVMVDRILDWGHSLGVRTDAEGCHPNILIVATDDGDRTARELVQARPEDFDSGVSQADRGKRALQDFQTSGRPVRWWSVSLPTNPGTGRPLVRLRRQDPFSQPRGGIMRPADVADYGRTVMGSRLFDDSIDALQSVVIVIDEAALSQANFQQLSDYVAMVALAQINPDTQPDVPSILSLFDRDRPQEQSLSRWDRAFLETLYHSYRTVTPTQDGALVAGALARRLQDEADENALPD